MLPDQQWRLLWEERLDAGARRRIWRAAIRGAQLSDPDEAAVAVEFARRRRRVVRTAVVVNSGMFLALLLVMAVIYDPPVTFTFWTMAGFWLFGLVATPSAAVWLRRNLERCEERNRQAATDPDG